MPAGELGEKFRFLLKEAFVHGLEETAPGALLRQHLSAGAQGIQTNGHSWEGGRPLVVAAGKAALPLAQEAAALLEGVSFRGIAAGPAMQAKLSPFEFIETQHPLPGEGSVAAAKAVVEAAGGLGPRDLFLFLLSGGATSMLGAPASPLTLADLREVFTALLQSGASIHEMNVVRKHLTLLGGGKLARLANGARIETLAISDVPGDEPAVIGSGPTVPDTSSFAEALEIAGKYLLEKKLPKGALDYLKDGAAGNYPETARASEKCFANTHFTLIGSARTLLESMSRQLAQIPRTDIWETAQGGPIEFQVARHLKETERVRKEARLPAAILSAGEPTAQIPPQSGSGGRASHFALRFALAAEKVGLKNYVLLSGATDGLDGNTQNAGAIVDGNSLQRARKRGLSPEEFLLRFDSGSFFARTGEALVTGPTGSNFSDVKGIITW